MSSAEKEADNSYINRLQKFNTGQGQVVLTSDVKNDKGVLLAAKGERLSQNHVTKMIQHKLQKPLEECVGLEPVLTPKLLRQKYEEVFEQYSDVHQIVKMTSTDQALLGCLLSLDKTPILLQKLTIMEHSIPDLFTRSLINSALALSLASYAALDKKECVKIFLVSLIENVGYLHLNEKLSDRIIPAVDLWREYHVHPIVAQKILVRLSALPLSVVRGVREHHERVDGTGFPRMVKENDICVLALYAGLIDELTRLKLSRENKAPINLKEAFSLLKFRQMHFNSTAFTQLQSLIAEAELTPSDIAEASEIKSFASLQFFYYSQCLLYCDLIARISDASSLDTHSKSIKRLHHICKSFIKSVFASGMLSQPVWNLIEESTQKKEHHLLQDLVEIDLAHHGILDRLDEILLHLEYVFEYEKHEEGVEQTPAFLSLNGCYAYYNHLKAQKSKGYLGWKELIEKMYNGQNEVGAILKSMQ